MTPTASPRAVDLVDVPIRPNFSHVWTLFIGLHLAVGFSGIGALMWGISQAMAGGPATPIWGVPIALFLHAFIAGAAFIGQGLGADDSYRLRSFVEGALGP